MKTDREFLDGIFEKASELEKNKTDEKNDKAKIISIIPKKFIDAKAFAAVAAVIIVVASVPASIYINEPRMETPKDYESNAPMAIRAMLAVPDTQMLVENSDLILTGKITKIEKSVYDEDKSRIITNVKLQSAEVLKGEITQTALNLKVSGGLIKKTDSFEPYEAVFKKSENVLLFLRLDEDNSSYILSDGELSKYSLEESKEKDASYIGKDDVTISIPKIKKIIKGD